MSDASSGSRFARRVAGLQGSPIDAIDALVANRSDIVRLAGGTPHLEDLPVAALSGLAEDVIRQTPSSLSYGLTHGEDDLRDAILGVANEWQEPAESAELLVTSGALQALDAIFKVLVDPGDVVFVESPTFSDALATLSAYEPLILPIEVDQDGMMIEKIPELILKTSKVPKLIYTIPTFQNPTGAILTLSRRRALLDTAKEYGITIVEDDPYGPLRYEGAPLPTLWSLDAAHMHVLAVRTFSKIVAPGLRVGWVFAPGAMLDKLLLAKQGMDTCTSPLTQGLVARFLRSAPIADRIARLQGIYRARRNAMLTALSEYFGGVDAHWEVPRGGYFLWLTLPKSTDAERLLPIALDEGVSFVPGRAFSNTPDAFNNSVRLCFVAVSESQNHEGIRRLRRAYDRLWSLQSE